MLLHVAYHHYTEAKVFLFIKKYIAFFCHIFRGRFESSALHDSINGFYVMESIWLPSVDPVMLYGSLFPVLAHPHIPEGGLAEELEAVH